MAEPSLCSYFRKSECTTTVLFPILCNEIILDFFFLPPVTVLSLLFHFSF